MAWAGILKAIAVWRHSVRDERARPKRSYARGEADFLPAAIEVMETPPSPIGRAVLWSLCAFLVLAVVWAWQGEVDIVAVAQGRIIPSDRIKMIQPAELGVVRVIHVREGQRVKADDLLVELDSTTSGADRDRLVRELLAVSLDRARLEAIAADPLSTAVFVAPPDAPADLIAAQARLLEQERNKYRSQIAGLTEEENRRTAQRDVARAQIEKLQSTLPLIAENVKVIGQLADQGYASRLRHTELRERLVATQRDLITEQERLRETEAGLAAIKEQRRQADAEFRTQILKDLSIAREKQAALEQELIKARQRSTQQVLRSPVDGIVQQLAIHTIGGVVQPAEALMAIVPQGAALEIEASLQNKDIGFVKVGQEVAIKFEAFPYTIHGLIRGTVADVSPDAVMPGRQAPAERRDAARRTTEPDAQGGLVYVARVQMERASMEIHGQTVPLGPGLAATVEIKTGRRSVLSYLLDPVLRYRSEAGRER